MKIKILLTALLVIAVIYIVVLTVDKSDCEFHQLIYLENTHQLENQLEDMKYDAQYQDSVINFLIIDNQVLTSYLLDKEIENQN